MLSATPQHSSSRHCSVLIDARLALHPRTHQQHEMSSVGEKGEEEEGGAGDWGEIRRERLE